MQEAEPEDKFRRAIAIHGHVRKLGKGKERIVMCKYCDQVMTSVSILRWESHLRSCKVAPEHVQILFLRSFSRKRTEQKEMMKAARNLIDRKQITTNEDIINEENGIPEDKHESTTSSVSETKLEILSKTSIMADTRHQSLNEQVMHEGVTDLAISRQACFEVRCLQEDLGDQYYNALELLSDAKPARTFVVLAQEDRLGWLKWKLNLSSG